MLKLGVITGFLGQTKDRFHEYNQPRSLEEKLQMVAQIEGASGTEIVFPYEAKDARATKDLLAKYKIQMAAVNVNVKAEPEFRDGGLTSRDKAVRARAVQFIKDSKDFAKAVGADKVTCCPLGDGYEYNFQVNYATTWKYLVETFGEAAGYRPEIPLHIEYKPSETRGKCFLDTAAKTLCLLHDIGGDKKRLGVTIDFGHSIYGQENPAEAVSLIAGSGHPYYIHINDNNGLWDWDFMTGTHHFLHYAEFLYVLQELGYSGFLTSDTSPTRFDIRGTFETNNRLTRKLWERLERMDRKEFNRLIEGRDYIKTFQFIETQILGLK
jgi:xylose isomerase